MTITDASIIKESQDRYLTYALSVVSGRALPDVRDGLKPVQRRILFAMAKNLGLTPTHTHRKSAAVVGEVLARFHPHGDVACYDAMVRMAQDFSLRYPLVDGQGNFGSMDGDNAAAYRYTEAKLRELAIEVLGEIDEETVAFRDNFDATTSEPMVLPSRVPNLLINGASGIAVGMAVSIPPHNLRDTVAALVELLDDPEVNISRLATIIKGPDFPTGCAVLNTKAEINEIYRTGRGSIRMRGEWAVEDLPRGKKAIIVSSVPYAVNKAQLVEKIATLIIEKKLPQLVDVRDESTDEVRIFLELASGADPELAMAYLFKNTPLESSFPVNFTALVPTESGATRPELLNIKDCLRHFLEFRREVTRSKLSFEKRKLLERIHILEGLVKIYDALDEALKIVRKSEGRADSIKKLIARFKLTELQAEAVVDMRIYQLSKTNIEDIRTELEAKEARVKEIDKILKSPQKISEIIKKDLESIAERFGDKRRSKLVKDSEEINIEFNEADYVVHEDVYAIVTADGWLKRIRQNNELSSTRLREGDSIKDAHALSTLDSVAIFTNLGSVYLVKVSDFPSSSGYGDPVQKILKFKDEEKIVETFAVLAPDRGKAQGALDLKTPVRSISDNQQLVLISRDGTGFIWKAAELMSTKRNGRRVMKLRDGDYMAAAIPVAKNIAMFTRSASGLVIQSKEAPVKDGAVIGVSLMSVRDGDQLVGAVAFDKDREIVLILEGGKEKSISTSEMLKSHRALKGNKVIARGEIIAVKG